MNQFASEVKAGLHHLADDIEADAGERLLESLESRPPRRGPRGPWIAGLAGLAAASAAIIGLNAAGLFGAAPVSGTSVVDSGGQPAAGYPRADPAVPDSITFPVKPGEPCYQAHKRSLTEVVGESDVPVWMPHASVASVQNFTGAWTCLGGNTPFLTFGAVTVSYESGWERVDVEAKWHQTVREEGGGRVLTILGRPGLVLPAPDASPKGMVLVVVDGVLIRVLGDGSVPAEQLVEVADSIELDQPL